MCYRYQRIKDLREDKDANQKEIAGYLNEHITTYQRWERGETEIQCHIVIKLCKLYELRLLCRTKGD